MQVSNLQYGASQICTGGQPVLTVLPARQLSQGYDHSAVDNHYFKEISKTVNI